jgi:hypothetical protein
MAAEPEAWHCFDHFICGGQFYEPTVIETFSSLAFWLPETQDCRLAVSTNGEYITLHCDLAGLTSAACPLQVKSSICWN